jgi:aspartate/methionine/tyrosine aminotransferase
MKSSRRGQVDPFIVMDMVEAARKIEAEGRRVIHMEVGQPGTPAPARALAETARAMAAGSLGYTVSLGLPELRRAIADLYRRWYGIDLDPGRVVVTSGSSGAFLLAFAALFDAGARVGLGEPGYPSYRAILQAMSLVPVGIQTRAENRFQPVTSDLARQDLQGLIVASPGNPAGTMLGRAELKALMDHAQERGISFISDEIYHGLHYGARAVSALEISDQAYVINSFSKYFSMTGWRVGWMVVPQDHVRTIERLAQNLFICAPHVAQVAALAALEAEEEMEANRAVYAANRKLMLQGLPKAGFTRIAPPDGAFYIYADVSDLTQDSRGFAQEVLRGAGVALAPGMDFDPIRGARSLRFSYARGTADIEEGLARLHEFMGRRG